MTSIHRLLGWHENPVVITWWRTWLGWALRWLTPRRRRTILAVTAVFLGTHHLLHLVSETRDVSVPIDLDLIESSLVMAAVFAFLWLCYKGAANFASLPGVVRRHPQVSLHLVFWILLLLLWNTSLDDGDWRNVLMAIALILPVLLWRLGYLLLSGHRGKVGGTRFVDHLIYLLPLHGSWLAPLPCGKGLDYLTRHEAQDEDALARSQLAGINLILLAVVWKAVRSALLVLVYGKSDSMIARVLGPFAIVHLPDFGHLLALGGDASIWQSWVSIYCQLVMNVLTVAIHGHVAVGVLRLFGFNIFRNTYKPLLAETVVQFWSRYVFYFKEILVDFFFLPTFAKWFRKRPALRMFAAVFAAAFVGNMYYDLIERRGLLALGDFATIWANLHSRLFYCLLLAFGIFVSMRREQRRGAVAPPSSIVHRSLRVGGVWTFFAMIRIWDHFPAVPFSTRTQFFFGLFGLA